jgi:hypothetical protein
MRILIKPYKNLLALCWLLMGSSIFAQFGSFVTYNIDAGLPSNTAYFIFKDAQGYIWITTDKGVVKYDGYGFTTYTTGDGLSDNEIFEAFQDSKKRIWLASYNGVPTLYNQGTFHHFENLYDHYQRPSNGPCYRIIETPTAIWIMNTKKIFKLEGNRLNTFDSHSPLRFVSICHHAPTDQIFVLFGSLPKALSIQKNNQIDTVYLDYPTSNISKSMIKGDMLFYTSSKNICMWNVKTRESFSINLDKELLSLADGGNDSIVLIGAADGVLELNLHTKQWKTKFTGQQEVSSIFVEPGGAYWTTSINNGVSFFGNDRVQALTQNNVLPFKNVSMVRKRGNTLLIASDNFRFCFYNLATQKVETFFDDLASKIGRGVPSAIKETDHGDTYISFRTVLIKIDKNGMVRQIPLKNVSYDLAFTSKYCIVLHAHKAFKLPSLSAVDDIGVDNQSIEVEAKYLYLDSSSNTLFTYGVNGLFKMNTDSFNRLTSLRYMNEFTSNISTMAKLNDSLFVVGSTVNGMHFFNNRTNKVLGTLSLKNGLLSNYINTITVYHNEIWVGTDRGINILRINPVTWEIDLADLGKKDGIFSDEINDILIENDTVYAASPFGLFIFNKNSINMEPQKPVLNIESVKFNSNETNIETETVLPAEQNKLSVQFTGISYGSMGNVTYRYKLKPVDNDWHYTNAREIEYPALGPASYELSLQCKGRNTGWSDIKKMEFKIQPAFWQRLEVRLFIAIVAILIIGGLIRIRIRILRKRHQIKERILKLENEKLENVKNQAIKDKEMVELEQQALRLHMNPHFIFNAINAIQGFYAGNEVAKAKQFISYFSRLLRLILETSKEKLVPVNTEVEIIRNYLELFLLRFEDKYHYTIELDPELDPELVMIPPIVVQPFVENAVLHGISPLKSKGEIRVDFKIENEILVMSITDNGIGRKKSGEMKMFTKSKSTGIKVTRMRLKHIDNQLMVHQNVEILDLEENGVSVGTKVVLRVPILYKE